MVKINARLVTIFKVFCEKQCKHRQGSKCSHKNEPASLNNCHIPEWWDLNDFLNSVDKIVNKIVGKVEKREKEIESERDTIIGKIIQDSLEDSGF